MRYSKNGVIYKVEVRVTVERYSYYVEVEATNIETGFNQSFSDVRGLECDLNIKECIDLCLNEIYKVENR